jgi:GNAT superfamily N-acetyltransferase
MPAGVVKTKKQKSLWGRAKSVVDKMKAKGHKVDDYWAMVMDIYGKLQGRLAKSRGYPVGYVSNRKDGSRWRKMAPGKWEEVKEATPKQALADLRGEAKGLGVRLDAWGGDGKINLGRIEVPKEKRGQGLGERVMAKLLALSDKHGQTLTLTPSGQWGGSVPKLRKWYKRLGFVENKGRRKDYEISEAMYRLPKVSKAASFHRLVLKPVDRPSQTARSHEEPEHPYHGQVDVQGIIVCIENRRGSVRRGPGWKTKMGHHYGEIRGTRGADGDALDAYVGDNHDSNLVVIVHQKEPGTTRYDEDKVMLGFGTVVEALKAYRDHYDRPGFYQSHTTMTMPEFQRVIDKQGRRGRKLTKAQLELLNMVGEEPLSRSLVVEIDMVKGGYDIGYVSTRKDGSQWRKVAQGKWEQVKLKGGVKAQPAKAEHYQSVADDMKKKAGKARHPFRESIYLGAEAASRALAAGKDDEAAQAAFDAAYTKAGGHEGLKNDRAVIGTVRRMHHRAVAKASQTSGEAKPTTDTKPKPAESSGVVASAPERAEHREQQRQSLENAGLDPHQIEVVQGKVPAPSPEKTQEPTPDEPKAEEPREVKDWVQEEAGAKGETPEELVGGDAVPSGEDAPPVPGGPPKNGKPEEPEGEKPWDKMTDREKKKAHEKLKAEHEDLLLLKAAVEEMRGMAMDPRKRAYHRVLKFMMKAVKQSGSGKKPTGAGDAHDEAKKAAGQAKGQAKRFFDRLADRLFRWSTKKRPKVETTDASEEEKKAAKKAAEDDKEEVTKSHREILDLIKAEKPIGHVSTYADGSQWKKTGPQKWQPVGEKKGTHDSPLMQVGHTVKLGDITARVSKVDHGGEEPMVTMETPGHGEGPPTPLSELESYLKEHGGEHVGAEPEKPAEKKPEKAPEKERTEGIHGTVDDLKGFLERADKERVYGAKLDQLDPDSQELAKHLAIYTNGDLDVFMDPSKFAPGRAWDSEKKDFVQQTDTAHVRANLGDGDKAQLDASFDATRQDYEKARKTIAELAGRQPPGDDMPPIIYRGLAIPDDVADALEEGASFDLGPVASFSGKEAVTGKFTKGGRGFGDRPDGHQGIIFVLKDPQVGTHIGGLSHFSDEDEILSTGKLTVDRTEMKDRPVGKIKYVYVTQEKLKKAKKAELDEAHQQIIREAFMQRLTDRKGNNP